MSNLLDIATISSHTHNITQSPFFVPENEHKLSTRTVKFNYGDKYLSVFNLLPCNIKELYEFAGPDVEINLNAWTLLIPSFLSTYRPIHRNHTS